VARRKKKAHHEEEVGEAWLLPYSDLMTLLLALFIALFAVSQVDQSKAAEMAAAFSENMVAGGAGVLPNDGSKVIPLYPDGSAADVGKTETGDTETETEETDTQEISEEAAANAMQQQEYSDLQELQSTLDAMFQAEQVDSEASTNIDVRGLVISLDNAILFDSGSATLKQENEETLVKIAKTISTLDNYIRIEGHTDNRPISNSIYPSNWELSAARASSVVRLFVEKGNITPDKLVAVGYGEFKPIGDNSTEEGRAQNRRIDIIILSEKYNSLEDGTTAAEASKN